MSVARALLFALAAGLLWAQGTVAVSGRITDAATGQPVEGAAIILEQGNSHASQLSDSAGNFSFDDDISAGPGRIQIQKEGYILFQRSNPDESSVQITGDHSEHNFKLTPAGSITGRIGRGDGDGVVVTLLQEDFTDGVERFISVASTNRSFGVGPDGSFRFIGLEPGRYIVSASYSAPGVGNLFNCSVGGQCIAAGVENVEQVKDAPAEGYVTTYYPGTTEFADALPVTLASGEKRAMDFRIAKRPLFRVSGEIEAPGIERAVFLIFKRTDGGPGESVSSGSVSIPGPFTLGGLPAGRYSGTASGMQGNVSFAITDHDVRGLHWVLHPAQRQQLTVDGSSPDGDERHRTSGRSVRAICLAVAGRRSTANAGVSASGHFVLTTLPGDDYSVLPVIPAGYAGWRSFATAARGLSRTASFR